MASDPHQNIFYYYRGPKSKKEQQEIDFQLENNTTKALMNTLYYSDSKVREEFISHFVGVKMDGDSIKFALQKQTIGVQKLQQKKNRILLGIIPQLLASEEDIPKEEISNGSESKDSLPDAWIWDENNVILVESKTRMRLNHDQLKRHEEILSSPTETRIIHWENIYLFFKKILENESKEMFLIKQFVQYLELINLSKFSGWKSEDFEFFYDYDENEKTRIKEKMQKLIDEILLEPKLKSILKISRQSKVVEGVNHLWYQLDINQDSFFIDEKTPFLNFTLELYPNSFQITVVFPMFPSIEKLKKVLKEKKDQIILSFGKYLLGEINQYPSHEEISQSLPEKLHFPQYKIRIFEHYAFWHTRKWIPKVEITLDQAMMKNNDWYNFMESSLNLYHPSEGREKNWGAGLHIYKEYPRGCEILEKPEDFIKDIQKVMLNFYDLVQTFIS